MITSAQYTVDGTAVKIAEVAVGHKTVHVSALGNSTVYLGGTNAVTSSTGYAITKTTPDHDIFLGPGDELWAICANTTTETITVLIAE